MLAAEGQIKEEKGQEEREVLEADRKRIKDALEEPESTGGPPKLVPLSLGKK